MGLEPTRCRKVKLFDFGIKGILPLDVGTIEDDNARDCCRDDLLEGSAGILSLMVAE